MKLLTSAALCLALIVMSCATVTVDYTYDPETDFDALRSFNWFPVPRENVRFDLFIKQVKSEIATQIHMKGFSIADDDPDFLIALHGGFQSRMDYLDWEYLYDNYQPYWAKRKIDITKYEDRQLIVDFIDTRSRELFYRATATAFVPESRPEQREKTLNDAVAKILENFPPQPGGKE
jgi:hypothetical protein